MLSNRRRNTLIFISVSIGTFLAALIALSRKGTFTARDWTTIGINFLLGIAIVFAIGILMKKLFR